MGTLKKGFSLIEVIVVLGVIALTIPVLFNIVFALMQQQVKLYRLTEIKRQGDYALAIIENTIRIRANSAVNGAGVPICTTAGDTNIPVGFFQDVSSPSQTFRYLLSGGRISSDSAVVGADQLLTTTAVTVTGLTITCSRTATFSTPIVTVRFVVSAGTAASRTEERAQLNYMTRIKLRSY